MASAQESKRADADGNVVESERAVGGSVPEWPRSHQLKLIPEATESHSEWEVFTESSVDSETSYPIIGAEVVVRKKN